jgi:hypothetical protein
MAMRNTNNGVRLIIGKLTLMAMRNTNNGRNLKPVDFIQFVCSLSNDFINQLRTINVANNNSRRNNSEPIRNRYLFHFDKIANGEVKFV